MNTTSDCAGIDAALKTCKEQIHAIVGEGKLQDNMINTMTNAQTMTQKQ